MSFRAPIVDPDRYAVGWGPVEDLEGVRFRWLVGERATTTARATRPFDRLLLRCRFADPVGHDVTVTVRSGSDESATAQGTLWWTGGGMQHRRIALSNTVPAGPVVVELEPIQTWDEHAGGRTLSLAVASLRGGRGRWTGHRRTACGAVRVA